ncbi:flagellar hook-associated protein FlgL [Thalassoglobus neptunius]|uniref:Flagellar hook-associated protein FlgL n=1 Tax=Thalassoglobus neptunius TaxID=1938619 RepID=A0A5C5VZ37_9PLAN|nr:hypothetical protein [Thalassoglobus neptunius]TWT43011.1 flagellar hook-associated protein FlgL [Thalassoglobus neptunius]
MNGFLETLETVANAKFDGKYLFSGTSTTQEPYSGIVEGPTQYQGSSSTGVVVLSGDDDLDVYLAGDEAFQFVDPESNELTDIFSVIRQVCDDLQSAADGNLEEAGTRLDSTIESLEVASEHLLSVVGRQAVVLQQLDRVEERTEDLQFQAESILSDLRSTDVASAVVTLQEEQNLLQFTFATTTRLLETSLLNFLG